MWKEFKNFLTRGNILELAVAFILGLAFSPIVRSLVDDIIMPPIGMLLGRVDFTNLFVALDGKEYASLAIAQEAGAPTMNFGLFINTIVNFIIIAFAIFLILRAKDRMKKKEEAMEPPAPTTKECPFCCSSIPIAALRCPHCTSELKKGSDMIQ